MNSPLRVLLVALLLVPPRVCEGIDPSPDDQSVAAAQGVSNGVGQNLHGVIGNLTAGKISEIYGEAQRGDPNMVAGGPGGTGASANGGANLPGAEIPHSIRRDSAPPPSAAPASDASTGLWGGITGWFSDPPPPPAKPVDNPSFSREVLCADGSAGCVEVMNIKENSPEGLRSVPITNFVDYGTVKRDGKADTQIWDNRPWWKFWEDPRQVNSDDIHQGGLGDCFLLASLAAVASKEPQVLRKMIKQQQGSLAVWIQFFDGEPAKPVMVGPVDEQFAVYKPGTKAGDKDLGGQPLFAAPAGAQGAIWPLLIEKAYAIKFKDGSFAELNQGGKAPDAMTHITGQPTHRHFLDPKESDYDGPVAFQDLVTWDSNSQPIVMDTKAPPEEWNPTSHKWESAGCPSDHPEAPKGGAPATPASAPVSAPVPAGAPAPAPTTDSVCTDPLYVGQVACLPGSVDPVCAAPGKIVKLEMRHSYWVQKIDAGAQTVTLANPWGSNQPTVTLPWTRLQKSLHYANVNEKSP